MRIISLFIICLTLFACSSVEKSDLEKYGLSGDVRSVTSIGYDVFDKFGEGCLQKLKPEYKSVMMVRFDTLGKIIYKKNFSCGSVKKVSTTNSDGTNRITKLVYYDEDDDTKVKHGYSYAFNDKGHLIAEIDLVDNDTAEYVCSYDEEGRLISQVGGFSDYERTWQYKDGKLAEYAESVYGMKRLCIYENGKMVKDVRRPELYWVPTYDSQNRMIEDKMYENGVLKKKIKYEYSGSKSISPVREQEWGEDGKLEHDYDYTFFVKGSDTVTVFKYDNHKLTEVSFYDKDADGKRAEFFKTEHDDFFEAQFVYEDGELVLLRDLLNGGEYRYEDDVVTLRTEKSGQKSKTTYKRDEIINVENRDKDGELYYSFEIEGDDDKKIVTIYKDGEEKTGEQIYEDGRIVKLTDPETGLTQTYSYNDAGLVKEIKVSDGSVITYEYDYDDHKNWVRYIEYHDGKPTSIYERSLDYYGK